MQAADAQSLTLAPPQPTHKAAPAHAPAPTLAEFAASQVPDARHLADAGLPPRWCPADEMPPCTPGPPPSKAPPVNVDARALLTHIEGVGASPQEVMALLYKAAGMSPPPAAQPKAAPPPLHQQGDAAGYIE